MTVEPSNETGLGLSPGAELRKAREQVGRSLEDVAHEMHMKVWQLDALEKDDYEELASPVFIQGYIRSYARLLELDAEPLLEAFSERQGPAPQPRLEINPPVEESRGRSIWLPIATALITAGLVASFVIWLNANGYLGTRFGYTEPVREDAFSAPLGEVEPPVLLDSTDRSTGPVETPLGLPGQVKEAPLPVDDDSQTTAEESAQESSQEEAGGQDKTANSDSAPTEAEPPKANEGAEAAAEVAKQETSPVAQSPKQQSNTMPEALKKVIDKPPAGEIQRNGGKVSFAFDEDSWVEVRDANGKLLIHGLREAGFITRLEGQGPYEVFLGNAPGVTIEVTGERFDISPYVRSNRTARFLLQQD